MKTDIKSILIYILLIISIIFICKFLLLDDVAYKNRIKELESRIDDINKEKSILDSKIANYERSIDSLNNIDIKLNNIVKELEKKTKLAEDNVNRSLNKLNNIKKELEISKKKIDELINNPNYRTGDDLIESLRNKTK